MQRSLSMAGNGTAEAITAGAREAQNTLVTASSEAANHVKSLAIDVERTLTAVGADTAASILGSAREAQSSLRDLGRRREPDQGDLRRHRAFARARHRQHHRQHPDQRAERAERAGRRLERSQLQGQVDLGRHRTLGARRQQQFRLDHDRQDRRNRHLRSAADRSSGADRRQQARFAGRGARRQDHPAHDRHRPRHRRRAEVDRDPRPGVLAIDGDQRLRRRAHHHLRRRTRHRRGSQVAEGPRAVVALGDRPVAPGLDRGRHRNAGDQQDPAHRHGRAVRAAARRQHPAAGSADRRPRQPQLAGARAGDPRGRLRVRHERRHLAQRRRHPDAGRPVDRLQHQDRRRRWKISARCRASSSITARRWSMPRPWSNRPTAPPPTSVAERKSQLESLVTTIDLRTTDLDQRLSRFTGLLDELLAAAEERARDIARVVAETAGAGSAAISRQFEAVRAAAEDERQQTARRHERAVPAEHRGNRCDVQAVDREVRHHGAGDEADGRRDAQRARSHPQRTAPRRARNAAGGRRQHRADAQGDRRPDRGAGRTEPDRRPSRPRPRRRHARAAPACSARKSP